MRAFPRLAAAVLGLAMLGGTLACTAPGGPPSGTAGPSVSSQPGDEAAPEVRAAALAAVLSDEQLVGQVIMPAVESSDRVGLGSSDVRSAADAVQEWGLGGVILLGNRRAADVKALTDALQAAAPDLAGQRLPLLIAADQEYGIVRRVTDIVQLPAAMAFGAAGRADLTRAAWSAAGQELSAIGVNVDFAPVADVIGPSGSFIGSRSYGSDADVVGAQVVAAVTGLQSAGVAAAVKHFPGHGNTTVDSHSGLPVLGQSRQQLDASDLVPFRAGIAAGVHIVMAGHLDVAAIDRGTPASFSSKVLVDLLRDELGFTGVVVSDALNMAPARRGSVGDSAVEALLAGNDLLLMSPSPADARAGLLDALRSGRLPRSRLLESVTRILTLKFTLAQSARPDMSTVNSAQHQAAAQAVAAAAITILSGPCSGPVVTGPVRITTSSGRATQGTWLAEDLSAAGVDVVPSGGSRVHLVGTGDDAGDLAAGAAVTVSMDTPDVLASAGSPVRIATYSSTRASVRALAAVLTGAAPAPGRSPVPVGDLPRSACTL